MDNKIKKRILLFNWYQNNNFNKLKFQANIKFSLKILAAWFKSFKKYTKNTISIK